MAATPFADIYSGATLQPTADVLSARIATVDRLVKGGIEEAKIIDLVGCFYGSPSLDLNWLRDELVRDDSTFSLINRERETQVIAAGILNSLTNAHNDFAILAIVVGSFSGLREPTVFPQLVVDAHSAMNRLSVSQRAEKDIPIRISAMSDAKVGKILEDIAEDDFAATLAALKEVRNEAAASAKTMAAATTNALSLLSGEVEMLREETQMLWWIFGGHSRALERSFSTFTSQHQAAVIAAVDLATLSRRTYFGPVAAPAMLDRAINAAKKQKSTPAQRLINVIDSIPRTDLQKLKIFPDSVPARIAPVMTAVDLARTLGAGVWGVRFEELTGISANVELEPLTLSAQLYREHLLGQVV
ncbi:hypothetical protein GT347_10900 [Xylophilus rhododendri]|uniref:GTPase-associated system helical domain-containing protein n=1 Tax=Xylophilus rhododendri TaxID=2697032 RepID=A0A857J3W0_9BURK|nr:GTPase-associated system all-helical protein GASH [Xylophilus rhododendri]QHI98456.1 hypothetical protein GT347_10900 [Xylophilus rhododendri]